MVASNDVALPNVTVDFSSSLAANDLVLSMALNDSILPGTVDDSASLVAYADSVLAVAPSNAALFDFFADSMR